MFENIFKRKEKRLIEDFNKDFNNKIDINFLVKEYGVERHQMNKELKKVYPSELEYKENLKKLRGSLIGFIKNNKLKKFLKEGNDAIYYKTNNKKEEEFAIKLTNNNLNIISYRKGPSEIQSGFISWGVNHGLEEIKNFNFNNCTYFFTESDSKFLDMDSWGGQLSCSGGIGYREWKRIFNFLNK